MKATQTGQFNVDNVLADVDAVHLYKHAGCMYISNYYMPCISISAFTAYITVVIFTARYSAGRDYAMVSLFIHLSVT